VAASNAWLLICPWGSHTLVTLFGRYFHTAGPSPTAYRGGSYKGRFSRRWKNDLSTTMSHSPHTCFRLTKRTE
jgi:hypothetical protein